MTLPASPNDAFPYQIESPVGEGAMGVVYRATEPVLQRSVAIKTLKPSLLTGQPEDTVREYRLRFLQEARAAASLSHPGATTIYRTGEVDGTPYIAMEWLEGSTLEELVEAQGSQSPERVRRLGLELLATLEAAHQAGIVHRDIKPANLILLNDGRLKVTDFGIARVRSLNLVETHAGNIFATPRFASPEQLQGGDLDGRSDLFAVGILLFYLLTGRLPFEGKDLLEVSVAILQRHPPVLSSLVPSISPGWDGLLQRALAKRADGRHASARAMADELESLGGGGTAPGMPAVATAGGSGSGVTAAVPAPGPEVLIGVPDQPSSALVAALLAFQGRSLGTQEVPALLDRLLERPLHAPPFSGALFVAARCLVLADGQVLAAFNQSGPVESQGADDRLIESLPQRAEAHLHPVPEPTVRALLALRPGARSVLEGLDSSFVNLEAMGDKLTREGFDGVLRLDAETGPGWVVFAAGRVALRLFTDGWRSLPVQRPWQELVAALPVRARVDAPATMPLKSTYRRALAGFTLGRGASGTLEPRGDAPEGLRVEDDAVFRFGAWAFRDLAAYFRERGVADAWKYLGDWLGEATEARLYHDLERPKGEGTDSFDLVSFDANGKALLLVRRVEAATPDVLSRFVEDVKRAKSARSKTGDVGGAVLVAGSVSQAARDAYQETVHGSGSGKFLAVTESFTGYQGFVRTGPRRGYHLLLVEEGEGGTYRPLLS